MTHKALIRRLQISCLGLDPVDPLRLLVDDVIEALRENAMREVQRLGQEIEQEPVAMLERTPRLGILRVTYEDAVTELHEGLYPLYVKPQIEVGCAECGVNGGYALYCVACAEKFVGGYKDSGVPAVETGLEQVSPDTPPQRTWVGLTDEEENEYNYLGPDMHWVIQEIAAKLKEKNT